MNKIHLFVTIVILHFFCSCVTQQRCNEKFPPNPYNKDSVAIKDSLIPIHDTVYIPGEILNFAFEIPDTNLNISKVEKKNGLTGTVRINKGKVLFKCKQDSLQHVIDSLIVVQSKFQLKTEKVIEVKTEYENHWYTKPAYWIAGLSLIYWVVVVILWVVRKVYGAKT